MESVTGMGDPHQHLAEPLRGIAQPDSRVRQLLHLPATGNIERDGTDLELTKRSVRAGFGDLFSLFVPGSQTARSEATVGPPPHTSVGAEDDRRPRRAPRPDARDRTSSLTLVPPRLHRVAISERVSRTYVGALRALD